MMRAYRKDNIGYSSTIDESRTNIFNGEFMKCIVVIGIMLLFTSMAMADSPTYELILKNDSLVSSTTYEFDIYINRTGVATIELAGLQPILTFDSAIASGTFSLSVTAGSSQLELLQQPVSMSVVGNILRINPRVPPGAGNGTNIPIDSGLRVGRFRLTSSSPFEIGRASCRERVYVLV